MTPDPLECLDGLRSLALGVLARALADAVTPHRGGDAAPLVTEAAEARCFLLTPGRAADLGFWCALADVDPVALRARAAARLADAVACAGPDRAA